MLIITKIGKKSYLFLVNSSATLTSFYTTSTQAYQAVNPPQDDKQRKLRENFWLREKELLSRVDYNQLDLTSQRIHQAHSVAIEKYHFTYDDPITGLKVMTRLRHFLRGTCCGNACREN